MKSFNLSDWALEHRSLVGSMIAFMVRPLCLPSAGRQEDPRLHHQDHGDLGAVAGCIPKM